MTPFSDSMFIASSSEAMAVDAALAVSSSSYMTSFEVMSGCSVRVGAGFDATFFSFGVRVRVNGLEGSTASRYFRVRG